MSTRALYWALEQADVKAGAFRVLVLLCDASNSESGASWLSVPNLVRRSGMSRATVIRAIQELHSAGYLVPGDKRHVAHIPNDRRPNVWVPNIHRGTVSDLRGQQLPLPASQIETGSQSETSRGLKNTLNGVSKLDPNQEQEPTTGTNPAQPHLGREAVSDLGQPTPGAVSAQEALDRIAACRAAIRKDQQ